MTPRRPSTPNQVGEGTGVAVGVAVGRGVGALVGGAVGVGVALGETLGTVGVGVGLPAACGPVHGRYIGITAGCLKSAIACEPKTIS
jgi:hypothetical protein